MQLVWFEVDGFKRFSEHCKGNFDSKLVAIVGPNESGKSSLLEAFQRLNQAKDFIAKGPSQEITRGYQPKDDQTIIEATFFLDAHDREAIKHVPEAKNLRWFSVAHYAKGQTAYITQTPPPRRDRDRRTKAAALFEEIAEIHALMEAEINLPESIKADSQKATVQETLQVLQSDAETLDKDELAVLAAYATQIDTLVKKGAPPASTQIAELLRKLIEHEKALHPANLTRTILFKRVPKFLLFDDGDRLLKSTYQLAPFFADDPATRKPIPKALQNLADASNLNLHELYNTSNSDDHGHVETMVDAANSTLKQLMEGSWSQSEATVRLRYDNGSLHILVGESRFVRIAERSDGLRQFIALLLFLNRVPDLKVPPIVLIDEVERHLHYDAQADIVQMLARQNVAGKIIYTTHSIGCMPEDLASIRLVEAVEEHSRIINWFWDNDRPGYSRLLFGMGASTLAFIPIRYAVIAEGAADLILLPLLLKAATGREVLGFQVAPGLSSASEEQLALIRSENSRTVFITDSDDASSSIRRKIAAAGIPEDIVLTLPQIGENQSVIEDFIDLDAYMSAVNGELSRSVGSGITIDPQVISQTNRPKSLERACRENNVQVPSKRAVAYRILEARYEKNILCKTERSS